MKIKYLAILAIGLACVSGSYAGPQDTTQNPTVRAELKDGFSFKNSQVMITRNGETKPMADDMKLADGVEIRTDGSIIVPGGTRKVLNEGDSMTFDGTITRADGRTEQLRPQ